MGKAIRSKRSWHKVLSMVLTFSVLLSIMSAGGLTQQAEALPSTGWWQNPDGHWYYIQNNVMLTGWRELPTGTGSSIRDWFYFREWANYPTTGPVGSMVVGQLQWGNEIYFLNDTVNTGERGRMITGWHRRANGNVFYHRKVGNEQGTGTGMKGSAIQNRDVYIGGRDRDFSSTGICSVATRPVVLNARILRDPSYSGTATQAQEAFFSAVATFENSSFFDIVFTLHNGNQVENFGGGFNSGNCRLDNTLRCNSSCGFVDSRCNGNHHRSDERIVSLRDDAPSVYTVRIVGHRLCFWDGRDHRNSFGIAEVGGKNSLATTVNHYRDGVSYVIRHELGHNLGAVHCRVRCIMNDTLMDAFDNWCTPCITIINRVRP
jgi:hypothetical protein